MVALDTIKNALLRRLGSLALISIIESKLTAATIDVKTPTNAFENENPYLAKRGVVVPTMLFTALTAKVTRNREIA
ncbi:MAG: hypothetical protein AT717_02140 [Vulcanisaeta sp. CIS_19]|jgi:hypothetical protein|nr:MAG: hypothetical protein AT717_02140 [Vulcanisaeta sp. CIS_19]MCG2867359.1 hypothetical protein [Vulcanisaeta sp.]